MGRSVRRVIKKSLLWWFGRNFNFLKDSEKKYVPLHQPTKKFNVYENYFMLSGNPDHIRRLKGSYRKIALNKHKTATPDSV
jgi:hypothetical protein